MGFKVRDFLLLGLIVVVVVVVVLVAQRMLKSHETVIGPFSDSPGRTVSTAPTGSVDQRVVGTYKSWGPTIVLEKDGRVYGDCFYPRGGFATWSLNGNIVSVQFDGRVTNLRISSDGRSLILREGNSDLVFIKQ